MLSSCKIWPSLSYFLPLANFFFCLGGASETAIVELTRWTPPLSMPDYHPKYAKLRGPWYARLPTGREIETVWQRPHGAVKGILFFAHDCGHQSTDLFTNKGHDGWMLEGCTTSNFNDCLGLPEHVAFRQSARRKGYLVMAVSGGRGRQDCWDLEEDPARVRNAIEHVRWVEGLVGGPDVEVPLILAGFGRGGDFVAHLARKPFRHLECLTLFNSFGDKGNDDRASGTEYPPQLPVFFQHMPRNTDVSRSTLNEAFRLRRRGHRVGELEIVPSPITATFLQRDGFGFEMSTAVSVVAALRDAGYLDVDGFLKRDPRKTNWPTVLRHLEADIGGFGQNTSRTDALLGAAFASHVFVGRSVGEALDFCEGSVVTSPALVPSSV
eukprot:TRINITY_DN73938_c0_g1_i1.p1 TRINITY_DN73938_c0_g1~~TRINITY_DN73938_c0_g1_i1.p1  ORF type:complete len:393 (+),score=32.03 TRINITY_DN73938_c0_g1_i1:38-1180(+)